MRDRPIRCSGLWLRGDREERRAHLRASGYQWLCSISADGVASTAGVKGTEGEPLLELWRVNEDDGVIITSGQALGALCDETGVGFDALVKTICALEYEALRLFTGRNGRRRRATWYWRFRRAIPQLASWLIGQHRQDILAAYNRRRGF